MSRNHIVIQIVPGIDDSDLGSFYSLKCLYDQGFRGTAASGAVFSIFFCYHEPALGQIDKDQSSLPVTPTF